MLPSLDWRSPHQPTCSWCRIHSRTHNPLRVTVWETAGPSRQGNRPTGTVSLPQITVAGSHNPITTPEHSYVIALQGPFQTKKRWPPTKQTIFSFGIVSHQAPHVFRVFIMRSVQKSAVQFSPIDLSDLKIDPAFLSTMSNLQSKRFKYIYCCPLKSLKVLKRSVSRCI